MIVPSGLSVMSPFLRYVALAAVVVSRAEVEGPERLAERNQDSAAEYPGACPVTVVRMTLLLDQVIRIRDTGFGLEVQTGVGRASRRV